MVTREELQQELWSADTYVDFDHGLNNAIKRLREALNDSAEKPLYIETLPRKGYRFIGAIAGPAREAVEVSHQAETLKDTPHSPNGRGLLRAASEGAGLRRRAILRVVSRKWVFGLLIPPLAAGSILLSRRHEARPLTERDTIVVADFANTTGDAVFDGTLRQGLAVQLEQSPFLSLVSETRVQQLLSLMMQPQEVRLTPSLARDLCERNGSTAVFDGSIAPLGTQYVLALRAMNCRTGSTLAEEQIQAATKEDVLRALDVIATKLRRRVGESMTTVERYDTPLAEATTPSLEALKAYSVGVRRLYWDDPQAATPFFQRAVALDPDFAAAYAMMSCSCVLQPEVAIRNIRKAYALRARVSERERLFIESAYDEIALGDINKAISVTKVWAELYPRELEPARALSEYYGVIGDAGTAAKWGEKALALGRENSLSYEILASSYTSLNRLHEAERLYKEEEDHKLNDPIMNRSEYLAAFFAHDEAKMQDLARRDLGKPGAEDAMLERQADTARWSGKLQLARDITQRASASAKHNDKIEIAATYQAKEALFEAEIGDRTSAHLEIQSSMKMSPNRNVQEITSLVLAMTGNDAAAEKLASELELAYAQDTLALDYWLPAIHAAIALQRNDVRHAVVLSQTPNSMELALPDMLPVYVRGEAYLKIRDGERAAIEFQKFVDNWGLVRNSPEGALARLGLARAYALQGKVLEARTAYEVFLSLWRNADPDIPLLKQAQIESAQLK